MHDESKKHPWVWKKIPGHDRNEALDCRNYALAAFQVLPKDLDAIDRQLKVLRGKASPEVVATPQEAPVQRPRMQNGHRSRLERYYDDW